MVVSQIVLRYCYHVKQKNPIQKSKTSKKKTFIQNLFIRFRGLYVQKCGSASIWRKDHLCIPIKCLLKLCFLSKLVPQTEHTQRMALFPHLL